MRAMLCKAYGAPESLVFEEAAPSPVLKEGQVKIRIRSAGVNFPDVLMIQGQYQFKPAFPFSPGAECAGDVIETAPDVTGVAVGDRVLAFCGHGAFAEEVAVPQGKCVPIPDDMDYETASSFGLTYGTSAFGLIQRGQLKAGEWLLVHGASGGVGLAAVEIGKAMGARVIGTGGSDEKLKTVLEHGADHVINYNEGPFKDRVKEICQSGGADVIYDAVGGDVFDQSLRCINWDGRLLVIGFASGRIPEAPANLTLLKNCSIVGVFWGAWTERYPKENEANFAKLFGWLREGKLKPHISHRFKLEQTAAALHAIINREVVGKAVVVID